MSSQNSAAEFHLEWLYSDLEDLENPPDHNNAPVHFTFLIRFPQIPPGDGHVAHFCFNVISPRLAAARGVPLSSSRGLIVSDSLMYSEITPAVEDAVARAFSNQTREDALEILNTQYIHEDLDFSGHFTDDVLAPETVAELIFKAFDGVERGDGITLHEALVIDDYGSEAEQKQARALDQETRWQDVSESDIESSPSYLIFLDTAGYRYYLPANMTWTLKHYVGNNWDSAYPTFLSLLPTVAPRDVGQGLGQEFDVEEFISRHSFTAEQVRAIYAFLCFMGVEAFRVSEDDYPAMVKWRKAALR